MAPRGQAASPVAMHRHAMAHHDVVTKDPLVRHLLSVLARPPAVDLPAMEFVKYYERRKYIEDSGVMRAMAKVAVDRSDGRLEVFEGYGFVNDELLQYIGDRSPSLKGLSLISLFSYLDISKKVFTEFISKCPCLEDLVVEEGGFIGGETGFTLSVELKRLKLTVHTCPDSRGFFVDEPFGIATMKQLRHLILGSICIGNEELMAIIDACPHLELLDVSKCYKLDVDDALRTKCAGIKTVKLPLSLSHDGDQYAYCDYQIDEYGDFIDDYADYF
ncbi:hypothetical protein OsI_28129 [Oryza sativa Indica Group]|uniref:Uncharacterized protein n=1 Tax=Oryza sativa subsp. indica TaxID=39946 RepID=B8BBH3_ORYSI|nr:hypothetical protein OsI_28129 [Oryza sativa Indica Group]